MLQDLRTAAHGPDYRSGCQRAGFEPDDLALLTLVHAIERSDKLPTGEVDLQRYLRRMMTNLLKDAIEAATAQKRGGGGVLSMDELMDKLGDRAEELAHSSFPGPITAFFWRDVRRIMTAEIQELPRNQRIAVELHLVCERSLETTAREMGCSVDRVRGYLQRGKEKLRHRLHVLGFQGPCY